MSVKQMALVWEHEFPYNQQLVMLSLADHANDLGEKIFPSIARQAWKTGYSPRQVGRILKELRDANILVIVKQAYRGRPTEYKFDWSKAKKKEEFRYANLDTLSEKGTPSEDGGGDTQGKNSDNKGDIAMSSKPSLKINHQKEEPLRKRDAPDFSDKDQFNKNIQLSEIMIYREVTGRIPGMPQMPIIYEAVQEHNFSEEDLKPYWREWVSRGYKVSNLAWLTEWAVSGEIPRHGGQSKKQSADPEKYTSGKFAKHLEN